MDSFEKLYPVRLMIAGAQKAGTTSLLRYLGDHPGICTHRQVEMTYFSRNDDYAMGYEQNFDRFFSRAIDESCVVLAKNVSVMLLPEAISRLYEHNPRVEIVLVLRNPVDRAYSHYWYSRRRGWEASETFEKAIEAEGGLDAGGYEERINRSYLTNGIYIHQLQSMLNFFPLNQIHVYLMQDLRREPVKVCQSIYRLFEELDDSYAPETERPHNTSAIYRSRSLMLLTSSRSTLPRAKRLARKLFPERAVDYLRDVIRTSNEQDFKPPPMNQKTRARLVEHFHPYNQELADLIGRNLDHWDR